MKMLCKVLLITAIALSASTISASAQKRADKTSSAKAYYGASAARPHYKQKKTKKVKVARSQSAKRAKADGRNRRKYS
jgi:hypothetical protein